MCRRGKKERKTNKPKKLRKCILRWLRSSKEGVSFAVLDQKVFLGKIINIIN